MCERVRLLNIKHALLNVKYVLIHVQSQPFIKVTIRYLAIIMYYSNTTVITNHHEKVQ